jgi:hypothetical protein
MPLSNAQGNHCFAHFWPKLFAGIKSQETRQRIREESSRAIKETVAQTQKRGCVVDLCDGAFLRLDFLVTFGSSQK